MSAKKTHEEKAIFFFFSEGESKGEGKGES